MAVCRWLYANAKMEGDRKDYFVRICDSGLEACKGKLIELSNRLLSADKRRRGAEKQVCWFAGYISREIYLVAAGGGQEELLGISKGRYREQYCVLGYGFTGDDICLLKKDDRMFEPLKEIMREIQRTGTERKGNMTETVKQDFSGFRMGDAGISDRSIKNESDCRYNICPSTEQTDQEWWKESLRRPVMLGIISVEDGKRMLQCFPNGMVTVIEDVKLKYDTAIEDVRQKCDAAKETRSRNKSQDKRLPEQGENHSGHYEGTREKGQLEQMRQELRRQKRQEQIRLVKYWAGWCKEHLSAVQVEAVKRAIENMKTEEKWNGKESGFFRQSEYSAYMLLWHDRKKRVKEQEIYFLIESWADTMNMKKTVQLAELIERQHDGY